ncbi:MAG: hypothetical protein OEL77_05470 [Nitrosopumilus sp.]|nr:hypothetical protein [Nitrosopumilus sp.]MDH3385443.1 hypothetical protein [Nitrosopumilus sp.]
MKDTNNEIKRIFSLEESSGWSYEESKGYQSGIVIFGGKSSKDGTKFLKISVNGTKSI